MRITYIAAGAGGTYCGACARDVNLARGLIQRGHDVFVMPVYMPLHVDGADPSLGRVFYGGINAYLQQHLALFRHTPAFLDRVFDRPGLLRMVSRFAIETRPEDLGAMTVSVLRGPAGRQAKELEKLVRFLEQGDRPDLINLTNCLLAGMAPTFRERLGVPIVCTFQGEESFVERLGTPYRDQALDLLRRHAGSIDAFVSPGEGYADEMADFLEVDRGRIRVIRTGLDPGTYSPGGARPRRPFRIGYLSRLSPAKGLDVLCEAFRLLARERDDEVVLAVAGQSVDRRNRFWRGLFRGLKRSGLADRVEYEDAPDLEGKVAFLRRCSVFCVPSRYPERRAVAVLEAQACGVPVVLPRRPGYDEVVSLTGGGILVEPDSADALAAGLASVIDDPQGADRMGRAAVTAVGERFSANLMVERTLQVYQNLVGLAPRPAGEERSGGA